MHKPGLELPPGWIQSNIRLKETSTTELGHSSKGRGEKFSCRSFAFPNRGVTQILAQKRKGKKRLPARKKGPYAYFTPEPWIHEDSI